MMPDIVDSAHAPGKTKVARISRWRQKKFSPQGRSARAGLYVKLAYGIFGLAFLAHTAWHIDANLNEPAEPNLPPVSWYWQFLPSQPAVAGSEGSLDIETDDDPFADEIIADEESQSDFGAGETSADSLQALWGTDLNSRSIRIWMSKGARDYIIYGILASLLSIVLALGWAMVSAWPTRPRLPLPYHPSGWRLYSRRLTESFLEVIDNFPKFLLLLVLLAFYKIDIVSYTLAISLFLMLGSVVLFRSRILHYLESEQYLYALEAGLSPSRIFLVHLLKRQLLPVILVQVPFMLSSFILYESTLAYLSWQASSHSWGYLIKESGVGNPAFYIPLVSILLVVSSLYILGDALRERLAPE